MPLDGNHAFDIPFNREEAMRENVFGEKKNVPPPSDRIDLERIPDPTFDITQAEERKAAEGFVNQIDDDPDKNNPVLNEDGRQI